MATNSVSVQDRSIPLQYQCWRTFKEKDYNEAIRLLPLVVEPKEIDLRWYGVYYSLSWEYYRKANLLHLSSRNGWLDVTKELISSYQFNPREGDACGSTCLHYAAEDNQVDIVRYLVNECNCDPMTSDQYGNTVLHTAARYGSLDVMKYLINHCHCNPMTTTWFFETVLHHAVRHIDVVKYLINECNCDPMATNTSKWTVLHHAAANGSTDVIKYLINECNCDLMACTDGGQTPLHLAAYWGRSAAVELLLSTGKCDSLAKDNEGHTPLQEASGDTRLIFKKFGQIKTSHPVDSYVNVLLLGNPGAGKSTLSHVITDTAGFVPFSSFRNVKGVEPCTAGIIPYKLQHKTLGNIILHDFAGHSEYYSSHSAVIENLLQGSGGVFLIVVNILEKGAVKQVHQWLTVVRNGARKAFDQCHVIVVVSHGDEISDPAERRKRKEEMQEIIGRERYDSVYLDCRKLGGSGMGSFFSKLSSACESIRRERRTYLSLYLHEMYRLLEEKKVNILSLLNVMSAAKDNDSYILPNEDEKTSDLLYSLDSIGLIKVLKSEDKVWVVVNKGILLSEVDGILFAPKTFKEHVDIASNTGIVSVSGLTRLFPDYDPDMLICFLKNMELCQEMNPSFLRMTNLHQLTVGESGEGETERREERLLFFPCLLNSDRPDKMVTQEEYQFGWCLQCTGEHHFFPPRYFHVLSLHLAYKLAQPQVKDKLSRRCTFWKNGLYWCNSYGVGVLVEIVDESQCVLVLMSCKEGYSMVDQRREVIGEVITVCKESCPSLNVEELVIDPKELDYPVNTPRERTVYSAIDVISHAREGKPFIVTDTGNVKTELKSILTDESFSDNLSLLGGCDIKVSVLACYHLLLV